MTDKKTDDGAAFLFAVLWLVCGAFIGFLYTIAYIKITGENLVTNDTTTIVLFVFGYLTFPVWGVIINYSMKCVIWLSGWVMKLLP